MGRFEPSGQTKTFRSGAGEIVLWFPGGDLAVGRVVGHVRAGLAAAAFAEIDRYAAAHEHPGRGFIDFSEMTQFDWEARMTLIRWNVAHRLKARSMDVLTNSWIVQLALRSLGTVLRDRLVAHESRESFESAYGKALAQRAGRDVRSLSP
jgi:hypothetical protein